MKTMTPAELRAEAARIEAEELLAERMAAAARVPTCPHCGGREFKVYTWTTVAQSVMFPEDPADDEIDHDGEWADDYESGDHTDTNESATCNGCGADVSDVLEAHGWTFYDTPKPRATTEETTSDEHDDHAHQ